MENKMYMVLVDVCPSWGTEMILVGIFATEEEAKKAMKKDGCYIHEVPVGKIVNECIAFYVE